MKNISIYIFVALLLGGCYASYENEQELLEPGRGAGQMSNGWYLVSIFLGIMVLIFLFSCLKAELEDQANRRTTEALENRSRKLREEYYPTRCRRGQHALVHRRVNAWCEYQRTMRWMQESKTDFQHWLLLDDDLPVTWDSFKKIKESDEP